MRSASGCRTAPSTHYDTRTPQLIAAGVDIATVSKRLGQHHLAHLRTTVREGRLQGRRGDQRCIFGEAFGGNPMANHQMFFSEFVRSA
jgi:hypothetical protein